MYCDVATMMKAMWCTNRWIEEVGHYTLGGHIPLRASQTLQAKLLYLSVYELAKYICVGSNT